ncbi:MAG: hypothetical protein LBR35_00160, partial [Rickettsiales bacterium]|nr:hypothetical protein [Rickettsiales bacterium]
MAKRIFGFDLGIASIGWAVIELDKENVNPDDGMAATGSIKGTGVRCFTEALNAADRRASRGTRRSLRHKVLRMKNIRNLLRDEGIIDIKDSDEKLNTNRLYQPLTLSEEDIDVWKLRTKHAFERILTKREIGRILYHLAKHRGYDDETYPVKIKEIDSDEVKSEKEKSDEEKALAAIAKNIKEAIKSDKTMAQLLYEDGEKIRNGKKKVAKVKKDGTTKTEEIMTYNNSIPRSYIRMEARIILKKQKELGNDFFTDDIFLQWEKIAFRQRKFNESASYLKKSIESMIGMCKHEKGEKCAPKEAPTS